MDEDSEEEKGMNGDLYPLINDEMKIKYNVLLFKVLHFGYISEITTSM